MEKYQEFLNRFGKISQNHINYEALEMLKKEYKDEISSNRILEDINDVFSLLKELDRIGLVQYNEISILRYIANDIVRHVSLKKLISEYNQWFEMNSSKISVLYNSVIIQQKSQQPTSGQFEPNMPLHISRFNANCTKYASTIRTEDPEKKLQNIVVDKLSKKIGTDWADVCRRLDIQESFLEDLEIQYSKDSRKSEKMFQEALMFYFSESRSNWKKELIEALRATRVNDLREMVEEIVYQNN